ncbi:hypothetical protein FLONG3_8793 [Fusarium longipes]|uniref:Uncharacterized protein n=1 Tax=Fusarium longipes TaxID=694270 RepID=A0A395S2W7_9HYPO|nr:hypothetical protein FLONG3_8793 [Fusarium longipes]
MIHNTLILVALAASAVAGPCKLGSSTELQSIETTFLETSITETTLSTADTETLSSIFSSDATTTAEVTPTSGSESTTTSVDVCVQSLTAPNGRPPLTDRLADCQDFNVVTVSSYEVTQTVYKRGNVIIVPTNAIARRAEGDEATTILPTGTPAYATYCNGPAAYYEACSKLGITASTTTIPEPTAIETITE